MTELVGTFIDLYSFLKKQSKDLHIFCDDGTEKIVKLTEGRKYIIPDFQREIRWGKENTFELIRDIMNGKMYLGNVIISLSNNSRIDIIDGQQRISLLFMIIQYIRSKYGSNINVFELCELESSSFRGLTILLNKYFCDESLTEQETTFVNSSDHYNQSSRFYNLWKYISESETFLTPQSAESFLINLMRCRINLVINTYDQTGYGIEYFLDVNLKGVKLDTEDILKSYIFAKDNRPIIRELWNENKLNVFKLEDKKINYPLTKMIEHYINCDILSSTQYKSCKFKENFLLENEMKIGQITHYAGEHFIVFLSDNSYVEKCLANVKMFSSLLIAINGNNGVPDDFKSKIPQYIRLDDKVMGMMCSFIKFVIRNSNVIPKILLMKYFVDILNSNRVKTKNEYYKLLGVYTLTVMFSLFQSKKDNASIYQIVRQSDWYSSVIEKVNSYFHIGELKISTLKAQSKFVKNIGESEEDFKYLAKSLAFVYNYLEIKNNQVSFRDNAVNDAYSFMNNQDTYSVEHFIICESKSWKVVNEHLTATYKIPTLFQNFKFSPFNFLFISESLNKTLENDYPLMKNLMVDRSGENLCRYSVDAKQVIIEKMTFPTIEDCKTELDIKTKLDNYFTESFNSCLLNTCTKIIENLENRIHN